MKFEKEEARKQLAAFLETKRLSGQLSGLVERGVLNRRELERQLHIPYSLIVSGKDFAPIIAHYNSIVKELGFDSSKWDAHVSPVRAFLEKASQQGDLPVSRVAGRILIDRTEIRKRFGLSKLTFTRHKGLRRLIEEFDRRIVPTLYPPESKYDCRELELQKILSSDDVPVYRGKINRTEIARRLDVDPWVLKITRKLKCLITNADQKIRAQRNHSIEATPSNKALSGEFDPWVAQHGRRYDFSEFSIVLGSDFTLTISVCFSNYVTRYAKLTAKGLFKALRRFLGFACGIREFVNEATKRALTRDTLERSVLAWREHEVENSKVKLTTVDSRIKSLNGILRGLAAIQSLPEVSPLRRVPNSRNLTRPKPSLCEMSPGNTIQAIFSENHFHKSDQKYFLAALNHERRRNQNLPHDPVQALEIVNRDRLGRVRKVAERLLIESHNDFLEGQRLLSRSDLTGPQIEERLNSFSKIPRERAAALGRLFPSEDVDLANGRFLTLLQHHWGGVVPKAGVRDKFGQFWSRRLVKCGGSKKVQRYVTADRDALTGALTLFLVDSGANLTVGRELVLSCFEKSDLPGFTRVVGVKNRSQGSPQAFDLPTISEAHQVTAVGALHWIKDMTALFRVNANGGSQHLFVCQGSPGETCILPEHDFTMRFKQMTKADPDLTSLNLVPSMIRPSVLLNEALKDNGNLYRANLKGHHTTIVTTNLYTSRYPTRLIYERKVRRFQQELQALVIANIESAAEKLGISSVELQLRLREALQNERTGGAPNISAQWDTMDQVARLKRILILADIEIIADLLQLNESLHASRKQWEAKNPERWNNVWLPWLVLTDCTVEQLRRGRHVGVYVQAKALAANRKACGLSGVEPW